MKDREMTCDPERIELFLGQQLSDEEQTAFELHLDDCDDCRRRLEETAAGKNVWVAVRDSLLSEQANPESPSTSAGTSSAGAVESAESSAVATFSADTVLGLQRQWEADLYSYALLDERYTRALTALGRHDAFARSEAILRFFQVESQTERPLDEPLV